VGLPPAGGVHMWVELVFKYMAWVAKPLDHVDCRKHCLAGKQAQACPDACCVVLLPAVGLPGLFKSVADCCLIMIMRFHRWHLAVDVTPAAAVSAGGV
jgi:hypothetical protein